MAFAPPFLFARFYEQEDLALTAQKGKDLLLKVDTNGAGSFVTVAGLRARTLAFNAATVDVTDTESVGRWRAKKPQD